VFAFSTFPIKTIQLVPGKRLVWLILVSIGLQPLASLSQSPTDNWYFGDKAGLSFRSGSPQILTDGQLNTTEGVATISDAGGKLLFYTDGKTIWNCLHQVMVNGTGLMGHESSTQSAVIVPQPGNDSIYFVFTVDAQGGPHGLRYSTVNMGAAHQLGAVVAKNH
jgi:hypothetical protein